MDHRPHITVATVVERDGRFLCVREHSDGQAVYNQPAGHVEAGESLVEAAIRETLEETRWRVSIDSLLGIYTYRSASNGITYVRHCFVATPLSEETHRDLDPAIIEACWLTHDELAEREAQTRSPLVLKSLVDYQAGVRHPLSLIVDA